MRAFLNRFESYGVHVSLQVANRKLPYKGMKYRMLSVYYPNSETLGKISLVVYQTSLLTNYVYILCVLITIQRD